MDWIKKNMAFVISCVVALIAIGVSGYYLSVEMGKYQAAGSRLTEVNTTVETYVNKKPHPGAGTVDNIAAIKKDMARLQKFEDELTGTFKSIPVGSTTEQGFKSELAETLAYIDREGKKIGLTTPTNFALSFTAQKVGFRFASNSLGPLSVQLADLKEITHILVDARVNSIESYKRVAVSADDKGQHAVEDEYLQNFKITTNQFTKAVLYPYLVTFRCFSEEFGKVLEGIAHSPYSIIVKTVEVEPGQVRDIKPKAASAEEVFGAALAGPMGGRYPGASPYSSAYGGAGGPAGGRPGDQMASRYGAAGRGDSAGKAAARYGAATARPGAAGSPYGQQPYGGAPGAPGTPPGFPVAAAPALPAGPEVILTEEPIKVTLGLAVIRFPETPAAKPATN